MRTLVLAMLAASAATAAHAESPLLNLGTLQLPEWQPKLVPLAPLVLPGADCAEARRRAAETQYPQILSRLPPAQLALVASPIPQACILPAGHGSAAAQPLVIPLNR
jgi:hypothetical protein